MNFVCSTMLPGLEIIEESITNNPPCTESMLQGMSEQLYVVYFLMSVIIFFNNRKRFSFDFLKWIFSMYNFDVLQFFYCCHILYIAGWDISDAVLSSSAFNTHWLFYIVVVLLTIRLGIFETGLAFFFIKKLYCLSWWEPFWFIVCFPKTNNIN